MASKLRRRRKPLDSPTASAVAHSQLTIPSPVHKKHQSAKSSWKNVKAGSIILLEALKETADVFPPLESAVAGVLVLIQLADQAKSNKKDSRELSLRAKSILDTVADIVGKCGPQCIGPDLATQIEDFTSLLRETAVLMKDLSCQTWLSRCLHNKENKERIAQTARRLDEALLLFMLTSTVRAEVTSAKIIDGQAQLLRGAAVQQYMLLTTILF